MSNVKMFMILSALLCGAASPSNVEAASPPSGWGGASVNAYIGQRSGHTGTWVCWNKAGTSDYAVTQIGTSSYLFDVQVYGTNNADFMSVHYGGPNYGCGSYGTINGQPLIGSGTRLELYGYGGNDFLYGGFTTSWMFGGDGNDKLRSTTPGATYLYGNGGNDDIHWNGTGAQAQLYGGDGDDCVQAAAASSYIDCGSGTDGFDSVSGTVVNCERRATCGDD